MALSRKELQPYFLRMTQSRLRLLVKYPFYGMLLTHVKLSLDEDCETAYTDGERIAFSPKFLDDLRDSEVDFVMMHEVLHMVLMHCYRQKPDHELFNIACDIVVNSNILKSENMDTGSITLSKYGESMHLTPDGKEGYEFTAEEVYDMIAKKQNSKKVHGNGQNGKSGQNKSQSQGQGQGGGGDDDDGGDSGNGGKDSKNAKKGKGASKGKGKSGACPDEFDSFDSHGKWKNEEDVDEELADKWAKILNDTAQVIEITESDNGQGSIPLCAQRLLKEIREPQVDWRTILNDFVQEDVCDYSFSPPDRRFGDSDFYLPDFNEKDEKVEKILFMIDTSGSMTDDMLAKAYTEIVGAINQFDGKLEGFLGFFDAIVYEPVPFASVDDVLKIRPRGGGGTNFHVIFEYVEEHMAEDPPASIIILTDGYADFPDEKEAGGIPVLWLINNDKITPPWGKIARIKL